MDIEIDDEEYSSDSDIDEDDGAIGEFDDKNEQIYDVQEMGKQLQLQRTRREDTNMIMSRGARRRAI